MHTFLPDTHMIPTSSVSAAAPGFTERDSAAGTATGLMDSRGTESLRFLRLYSMGGWVCPPWVESD
jgi:hypothetical protein